MDFISEHQLFVCVLIGLIYVLIRYVIEWAKSALYVAARRGDLERVKRLVKLGWKINAKDCNGYTVLHSAAQSGNLGLVQWLVEQGVDVNAKDSYGNTIMEEGVMGLESILFVKIIDYGLFGLCSFLLLGGWIFVWFFKRAKKFPEAESGLLITATTMGLFYLSGNIGNISALSYALIGLLAAEVKNKEELLENEETDKKEQQGEKP